MAEWPERGSTRTRVPILSDGIFRLLNSPLKRRAARQERICPQVGNDEFKSWRHKMAFTKITTSLLPSDKEYSRVFRWKWGAAARSYKWSKKASRIAGGILGIV
jgi:hypothetical protein